MHNNTLGKEVKKAAHSNLILCSFRSGGGRMGQVVSGDQNSHPKSASTVIINTHTHTHTHTSPPLRTASVSWETCISLCPTFKHNASNGKRILNLTQGFFETNAPSVNSQAYGQISLRHQHVYAPIHVRALFNTHKSNFAYGTTLMLIYPMPLPALFCFLYFSVIHSLIILQTASVV
jgi:hypothetical protein